MKINNTEMPLDLSTRMEIGEQSNQPAEAEDNTSHQANVEDNLPTEAELEAEIERVKDGVVESLLLFNRKWKQWECKSCRHRCDAHYRLWEHIVSCHF